MEHAGVAVSTIASWTQTFPGDDPWVVEVVPTADDEGAAAHVRPYVELLAGAGVRASSQVLHGSEPVVSLDDFAGHIVDPVLVATSVRWTDGQRHWHSETRELVRHSTHPVLVVPPGPERRRRTCPELGICASKGVELGGIEPPSISRWTNPLRPFPSLALTQRRRRVG